MKVYVLCRNFLDKESLSKLTIGGVQTYIDNLIPVISSFGCNVVVIQYSKRKFSASYKGATVIGVTPLRSRKKSEIKMLNLFYHMQFIVQMLYKKNGIIKIIIIYSLIIL